MDFGMAVDGRRQENPKLQQLSLQSLERHRPKLLRDCVSKLQMSVKEVELLTL